MLHNRGDLHLGRLSNNVVEFVQTTSVVSRETPEHSPATPIVVEAPGSATVDVSSAGPRSSYLAEQLLKELGAKEEAIRLAREADDRAALESRAKENALRTLSLLQSELATERHHRNRAERAAQDTLEQLSRERRAREDAETWAKEAQRQLASSAVERTPEDPTSLPPATTAKIQPASGPPVAANEITP